MNTDWPAVSYFNSGTAEARMRLSGLDLIERSDWYLLYRRRADGTYWRLPSEDKFQQRFLVRIDHLVSWAAFDSSPQERQLLLDRRGGLSSENCIQADCPNVCIKGSAFCLPHTYERGVRK